MQRPHRTRIIPDEAELKAQTPRDIKHARQSVASQSTVSKLPGVVRNKAKATHKQAAKPLKKQPETEHRPTSRQPEFSEDSNHLQSNELEDSINAAQPLPKKVSSDIKSLVSKLIDVSYTQSHDNTVPQKPPFAQLTTTFPMSETDGSNGPSRTSSACEMKSGRPCPREAAKMQEWIEKHSKECKQIETDINDELEDNGRNLADMKRIIESQDTTILTLTRELEAAKDAHKQLVSTHQAQLQELRQVPNRH
jgi:hypothetical protein